MNAKRGAHASSVVGALLVAVSITAPAARGGLKLGPEELVQAGGVEIAVPGYSVPSFCHWDGDDLKDLVVGQGSGSDVAKVRVYLNAGTAGRPQFSDYSYVQSEGADLVCTGSGCLGVFPRVVYWDADDRKDLLAGLADGRIKIYLNTGTDDSPSFDGGTFLQVGEPGFKTDIHVSARATPSVVDWNNDARKDLVCGSYLGLIHLFLNEGTDTEPDFRTEQYAMAHGTELLVPTVRSSPDICDLDDDGKKDILTGNTAGQLLFYSNTGSDDDPSFGDYLYVEADGVVIDLAGSARSRPSVCDWNDDGLPDVLIGASDGKVHLHRGRCPADLDGDGLTALSDLATLLAAYGSSVGEPFYNPNADLDGDGVVDTADLGVLLADYGCEEAR